MNKLINEIVLELIKKDYDLAVIKDLIIHLEGVKDEN